MFRSEYLFNFDRTFEIHDDIEVLKRMGLSFGLEKGHCTSGDLSQALRMVPKSLEPYVTGLFYISTLIFICSDKGLLLMFCSLVVPVCVVVFYDCLFSVVHSEIMFTVAYFI